MSDKNKDINIFNISIQDGTQLYVQHDLRPFNDDKSLEPLYMLVGMLEKFKLQTLDRIAYIESGDFEEDDDDFEDGLYDDDFNDGDSFDGGGNWKLI